MADTQFYHTSYSLPQFKAPDICTAIARRIALPVNALILLMQCVLIQTYAQESGLWKEVFFENKAKNFAVITAKFATGSYYYAKNTAYTGQGTVVQKALADTCASYAQFALRAADSTLYHIEDTALNDSIIAGVAYLRLSMQYLRQSIWHIQGLKTAGGARQADEFAGNAMFAAGNALVDAYNASLYLHGIRQREPFPADTLASADSAPEIFPDTSGEMPFGGFKITNTPEREKQIKRLEADEATYSAVADLYEQKIKIVDQQLGVNDSLIEVATAKSEKKKLQNQSSELTERQNGYKQKLADANKDLGHLRDMLSQVHAREAEKAAMAEPLGPSDFSMDKYGFYNPTNPIPMLSDEDEQDGLIFKVQIGYYSKGAKPKWFDGLSPITGHIISEHYVRYTAGVFYDFNEADRAKDAIRSRGIQDAFVVAYNNGEKISVSHAIRLWLDALKYK